MLKAKRLFRLIVSSILIFTFAVTSYANNSLKDLQSQQSQIRSNTQSAKDKLKQISQEKSSVLSEIDYINTELENLADELELIAEELDVTELALEKAEAELVEAEANRESQFDVLKERLRFMYINKNVGYLDILLSSASISDFLNRVEYITLIYDHDKNMLSKLTETEEGISGKVTEITNKKNEILTLKALQTNKTESLEETLQSRKQYIESLDADEQKYSQQIKELEDSDNKVAKLIKDAQASMAKQSSASIAPYTGGKLMWPVPSGGKISSGYGYRTNPINKKKEFHKGVDIPAKLGSNIVAAEAGVIIYSGWMNGLGNTVIIEHNGLSTLYGHASKNVVKVGQTVSRGEVISKIGSTGYSTGPHCHFEVHTSGGATTNPVPYLKK